MVICTDTLRLDIRRALPETEHEARQQQYQDANADIRTCLRRVRETAQTNGEWIWRRGAYFKLVDEGELYKEGGYDKFDQWSFAEHKIQEPQARRYIEVSQGLTLTEAGAHDCALAVLLEMRKTPNKALREAMGAAADQGASARMLGQARVRAERCLLAGSDEQEATELLLYEALLSDGPVNPPEPDRPPSANIKARQVLRAFERFVQAVAALLLCPGELSDERIEGLEWLLEQLEEVPEELIRRCGRGW